MNRNNSAKIELDFYNILKNNIEKTSKLQIISLASAEEWKEIVRLIEENKLDGDFSELIEDFGEAFNLFSEEGSKAQESASSDGHIDFKEASLYVQKISGTKVKSIDDIEKVATFCKNFEKLSEDKKDSLIKKAGIKTSLLSQKDKLIRSIPYVGTVYSFIMIIRKLFDLWGRVTSYLEGISPIFNLGLMDLINTKKLERLFDQNKDDSSKVKELATICIYMLNLISDLTGLVGHSIELAKDIAIIIPQVATFLPSWGASLLAGEGVSTGISVAISFVETAIQGYLSESYSELLQKIKVVAEEKAKELE